jgi:ligand-binding sensor domain-containing protein
MAKTHLILVIWLLSCRPGFAAVVKLHKTEGPSLRFAHLSFGEGPSRSSVRQIVQDDQGFMWFGTQDGLNRFDGYRVQKYRSGQPGQSGISGANVATLFKDRAGYIWVASDLYLDRYDPTTEKFTRFRFDDGDPTRHVNGVQNIDHDKQGRILLSTSEALCQLEPMTGKSQCYRHKDGDRTSVSGAWIRATLEMKDGTFWVLSTGGLDIFDRRTGKVTGSIPLAERHNSSMLGAGTRLRLLADRAGTVWVTMPFGSGLAMVDRDSMKLVECSFEGATGDNPTEAIHEDEDGNLWLGSDNGLLKISPDRRTFVRYRHVFGDPDSLSADQVRSLFEDREGNIWVGTQGGGVNRFAARPKIFKSYRHEPGNPNSLEKDEVTSVYEDSEGILWVGNRVALNRIDRKTGKATVYRDTGGTGRLSNTYILSIVEDRAGFLWFGTSGGGLNRFDRRDGSFRVYRHDPSRSGSLSDDIVHCLFVDRHGTLWAGTNQGLDRYDPQTDCFHNYRSRNLPLSDYRTIDEDTSGELWLSTLVAGVIRFDPATGSQTFYRHTSAAESLTTDRVNMARTDPRGFVWAATANGLNRLDRATGRSAAYFERDGLPNDNLSGVLVDDDGDLWVSTNNGLSRFTPRTNRFRNY